MAMFKKDKFVGFNPTVKRTVVYCEHEERGKLKISKGLVDKVLVTGDDGGDCWVCADAATCGELGRTGCPGVGSPHDHP